MSVARISASRHWGEWRSLVASPVTTTTWTQMVIRSSISGRPSVRISTASSANRSSPCYSTLAATFPCLSRLDCRTQRPQLRGELQDRHPQPSQPAAPAPPRQQQSRSQRQPAAPAPPRGSQRRQLLLGQPPPKQNAPPRSLYGKSRSWGIRNRLHQHPPWSSQRQPAAPPPPPRQQQRSPDEGRRGSHPTQPLHGHPRHWRISNRLQRHPPWSSSPSKEHQRRSSTSQNCESSWSRQVLQPRPWSPRGSQRRPSKARVPSPPSPTRFSPLKCPSKLLQQRGSSNNQNNKRDSSRRSQVLQPRPWSPWGSQRRPGRTRVPLQRMRCLKSPAGAKKTTPSRHRGV